MVQWKNPSGCSLMIICEKLNYVELRWITIELQPNYNHFMDVTATFNHLTPSLHKFESQKKWVKRCTPLFYLYHLSSHSIFHFIWFIFLICCIDTLYGIIPYAFGSYLISFNLFLTNKSILSLPSIPEWDFTFTSFIFLFVFKQEYSLNLIIIYSTILLIYSYFTKYSFFNILSFQ